jgi:nucleoid-associated protein YejK
MITLRLKDSGATLGSISEADLQVLLDQFEEESSTDRDYFIDEQTVQLLEDAGASPDTCALLRKAVGSSDGIDIVWSRP